MVQLNLLPDVKAKYVKSQRAKRTVILSSVAISGTALAVVVLMASVVYGAQKLQLSSLDNDIKANTEELQKIEDLDKILTIQNQLNALDGLHADKPVVTRVFAFLPQITPNDVSIATYDLKFEDTTMSFTGTAKDLVAVNKFVDTLKFTKYITDGNSEQKSAFSEVVLSNFSRNEGDTTYTVTLKFDPELFNGQYKDVSLVVPNITTTRSETERPNSLFQEQENQNTEGTN
jgi:hypothetical protein